MTHPTRHPASHLRQGSGGQAGTRHSKGAVPKGMASSKNSKKVNQSNNKRVRTKRRAAITGLIVILFMVPLFAIDASEAENYVGEVASVCGYVADTKYEIKTKGEPTFLDFTAPYPAQDFSVVIWGYDRKKFDEKPEEFYLNKSVCARGKIRIYRGKPHIFIDHPKQLVLPKAAPPPSEEDLRFFKSKEYHEYKYTKCEVKMIKLVFKALGYKIDTVEEYWTRDICDAVFEFQENNRVKKINGKLTRKMILLLEDNVHESEELSYKRRVHYWNMVQKLLRGRNKGTLLEDM